jgi:DnaJ-class molecular chaperone
MAFTPPPPEMQARQAGKTDWLRQQARAILGVEADATEDQINRAFRATVKFEHPDAGGAGFDMAELKWARDLLLEHINQATAKPEKAPCPACRGRGNVLLGFKSEPCPTCGGAGEVGARR